MDPGLQNHYAVCSLTGLGFRLIAREGTTWLNHTALQSRNPTQQLDMASATDHLRYPHANIPGPWKSVYCSWQAAMRRRQTLIDKGATEVYIIAIDLEGYLTDGRYAEAQISKASEVAQLQGVIDAYSLAIADEIPGLDIFGYDTSGPRGFPKEYLLPYGIPQDAVVACIPATGPEVVVDIHLSEMLVPQGLISVAREASEHAISQWVENKLYERRVRDPRMRQRVMRAMCVRAWDYDFPGGAY